MLFYRALEILVRFLEILILIRIIMSFINFNSNSSITRFVYELTEPVLSPARALIDKLGINTGMFDFSPIVAMLCLRGILNLVDYILF